MKQEVPTVDGAEPSDRRYAVYKAVDRADNIHRPMPEQHPCCLSGEEFEKLTSEIDPLAASVQWACRRLPMPPDAQSDLSAWAFFVEVASAMWIVFDDLPKELAGALLHEKRDELLMRSIQRPFSSEELAQLVEEIKQIEPAAAVTDWSYAEFCDPYGCGGVPSLQVGREGFVKASGNRWVWFGDLPGDFCDVLRRHCQPNSARGQPSL